MKQFKVFLIVMCYIVLSYSLVQAGGEHCPSCGEPDHGKGGNITKCLEAIRTFLKDPEAQIFALPGRSNWDHDSVGNPRPHNYKWVVVNSNTDVWYMENRTDGSEEVSYSNRLLTKKYSVVIESNPSKTLSKQDTSWMD